MIAQQSSIPLRQAHAEPIQDVEAISLNRIVAVLQVVLATRRAAYTDDNKYWYTLARGM